MGRVAIGLAALMVAAAVHASAQSATPVAITASGQVSGVRRLMELGQHPGARPAVSTLDRLAALQAARATAVASR